ncbi:hypothetical protein ABQJ54_09405 [Rhodanobacter sp. Si-c]|uniref:Type 1 fimbrial protein n=1 Tax=Rhodanobacter lycopersici TaxID=3162487 RepID=A0ABV3QDR4_9GAMM
MREYRVEGSVMRVPQWLVWVGCFLVSLLASPVARAGGSGTIEGGTITFVGAIVAPTCSIAFMPGALNPATGADRKHRPLQQNCPVPTTAGTATTVSRPYSVSVVRLSTAEPDRVLRYFAGYVLAAQPSGSAGPVLVTQTYE